MLVAVGNLSTPAPTSIVLEPAELTKPPWEECVLSQQDIRIPPTEGRATSGCPFQLVKVRGGAGVARILG